jgi:hypothetical protein
MFPSNSPALQLYAGFAEGWLGLESDWATLCFWTPRFSGTVVACTAHETWIYYGEQSQFIAYDGEVNSFRSYRVQLPDGSFRRLGSSGFAGLRREISTPALTIARRLWLGLYWLNVYDG